MRNTRSSLGSNYSETRDKYGDSLFQAEYYPINFVASDNFIFLQSLWQKHKGTTGYNLANKAQTWLYGPMRNPVKPFRGNINGQLDAALNFIRTAANAEYIREREFLERYAEKNPQLRQAIEEHSSDGEDKYINLINDLNIALKGREIYEKELDKEIERIKKRQDIMKRDEAALKEGRHVAVKKDEDKEKLTTEEYNIRNELNGTDSLGDTVLNPYFNFDGKKIFDSMFKKNSDFSIIAEAIMVKYGSRLIEARNGHLQLNKEQSTMLVKVLIQKAYEILAIEFKNQMKKQKNETSSARKKRLAKQIDSITQKGGVLDQYFNDLMNAPDPKATLESLARQNGLYIDKTKTNALGHSTRTLNERIKKIYLEQKAAGKTDLGYRKWKTENNLTKMDVEEFVYLMANVEVQTYYTNEGAAAATFASKGMTSAVGGGVNAPTDVNAGYLVCTFEYKENPEAAKRIAQAQREMSQAQTEMLKQQKKVTNAASYEANLKALQEMEAKQLEILESLKQDLEDMGVDTEDMITHINIHGTIKGYASIDATTDEFQGASFGTTITDQVEVINTMLVNGGISPLDAQWLTFALINCGKGMIGASNKHALEDYLSGYVGLLMFSDASFIARDVADTLAGNELSSVQDIHLYVLNDKYIPSSYILHETYKAMESFVGGISVSASQGTMLELKTYDNAPQHYNQDALRFPEARAWHEQSENALHQTHLTMYFLANFMGLLRELQNKLSSI